MKIDLNDAPKFDATITVRGVKLALVSPMEVPDLPPGPMPRTRAEIDAITGRRPGAFVRLWRFMFGEPGVDPKTLPEDGGAAQQLLLATVMVGEHHAAFLRTLTTGEVHQIVQAYMGVQMVWSERVQAWAAEQARRAMPEPDYIDSPLPANKKRERPVVVTPDTMVQRFREVFGEPRLAYAEGLDAEPVKVDGLSGGVGLNGQVPGTGKGAHG